MLPFVSNTGCSASPLFRGHELEGCERGGGPASRPFFGWDGTLMGRWRVFFAKVLFFFFRHEGWDGSDGVWSLAEADVQGVPVFFFETLMSFPGSK